MLDEIKKLHSYGFAIHWLRPRNKMPVESGWTKGPRKSWEDLERTYKKGFNVGVRLGLVSKVGDLHLAVIDCDVKSLEQKHQFEMKTRLDQIFGVGFCEKLPQVASGRGNGSSHYYLGTTDKISVKKLAQSKEVIKVKMPSAGKVSKREKDELTAEEIASGLRLRPAWEISLMGDGGQVVLPPSIHPDSGKPYKWVKAFKGSLAPMPVLTGVEELGGGEKARVMEAGPVLEDMVLPEVELAFTNVPSRIIEMIIDGTGVEDRSASLFIVAMAMLKAGLSKLEIASVLTEKSYFLGGVAYEHARTNSRKRAANWILKYTLQKAEKNVFDTDAFTSEVAVSDMAEEDALELSAEVLAVRKEDWKNTLERTGGDPEGKPKGSQLNVQKILIGEFGENIIKRDIFAIRDFYGCNTPWGGKKGEALSDDDIPSITSWLSTYYGFEPPPAKTIAALTTLARKNAFHPVRDFLENLPPWDGVERLNTWLEKHFGAKPETKAQKEYYGQVFRKWMYGAVLRVMEPGAKFDWAPIFEGKQGVGKSSFGRLLCGDKWFLDWLPNLADKDSALSLQGNLMVELSEMSAIKKNEVGTLKAFLTRTTDKYRPPYGRLPIEAPRQCVFFGTTNEHKYLKDETGNRRFKPVVVGKLDFNALKRDRLQLWAEAYALYCNGFESTTELEGEAEEYGKEMAEEKRAFSEPDRLKEELLSWVENLKKEPEKLKEIDFTKVRIKELFEGVGVWGSSPYHAEKATNWAFQIVSEILEKRGCKWRFIRGLKYFDLSNLFKNDLGV